MIFNKILKNSLVVIFAGLLLSACATKKVSNQIQGDVYTGKDTIEYLASGVPDRVFFATNESVLTTASRETLRKQAAWLRKNSKINGLNKLRIILSFVAAILFKIFFNIKNVRDYTCGFRAYKIDKIRKIIKNYDNFFSETGFSVSADILLKLYPHRKSFLISEEPLDLRYDLKKGKSKMRILKTIFLTLKLLIVRKFFKY